MKFRIREIRKTRGLTQAQMAERLEISTGLYSDLETGKRRMNETYLEGIGRIFGVRPSLLIVEDDQAGADARLAAELIVNFADVDERDRLHVLALVQSMADRRREEQAKAREEQIAGSG